MKAKERHHLKENEFAATTMRAIAAIDANRGRAMQIADAVSAYFEHPGADSPARR